MKTKIVTKNGESYFDVGGTLYAPAMFRSFRPTPANVGLFARRGVKLFQFLISSRLCGMKIPYSLYPPVWLDYGRYDFAAFDCQMEMFLKYAPDGLFCPFIQLDTPAGYVERVPDGIDSFQRLDTAMFDGEWKREASDYARKLIAYAEEKYGDRIFAYAFTAGRSCEWFMDNNIVRSTPDKLAAYRRFTGDPEAVLPDFSAFEERGESIYRPADSAAATYARFLADSSAELVNCFAAELQREIKHEKPIGTFYGYVIFGEPGQNLNGHNSHMKVFESPDIDMIFSPAAYGEFRRPEEASGWQLPVDSVKHHGKLYMHEIDHRTPLARYPLEVPPASGHGWLLNGYRIITDCFDSMDDTVEVLRRELCAALAKGSALWWFDFFGGYYADPRLEEEIQLESGILERLKNEENPPAWGETTEIALFVDPRSFESLRDTSRVSRDFVRQNFLAVGRCGAPYAIYSLADLETLDTSRIKLAAFLNAFTLGEKISSLINKKLSGAKKLWLHAPGWEPTESVAGVEAACGIKTSVLPVSEGGEAELFGEVCAFRAPVAPVLEITDSGAEILGRYVSSGKAAAAEKNGNILCPVSPLGWKVWHELATRAGCHMWTEGGGSLYASERLVGCQSPADGPFTVTLPRGGNVVELFTGARYAAPGGRLTVEATKNRTMLFEYVE